MTVFFTSSATKDLENINSYLSQHWGHNSQLKFESKLRHSLNLLPSNPRLGILENVAKIFIVSLCINISEFIID